MCFRTIIGRFALVLMNLDISMLMNKISVLIYRYLCISFQIRHCSYFLLLNFDFALCLDKFIFWKTWGTMKIILYSKEKVISHQGSKYFSRYKTSFSKMGDE